MSNNVWFLSDTHFGHKNIVRACSDWPDKETSTRDFVSVEDHDNYLIDQINKKVKSTDTLYHLGDFGLGFGWKVKFFEIRQRIKCENLHGICGNHDGYLDSDEGEAARALFKSWSRLVYKKIVGRPFVLCHYAMRTWPWQHHQGIHLYGHSHGNLPDDPNSLSMDVGVDTELFGHTKYSPYSADEIFHIMYNYKKFKPVDHHAASSR